MTVDDIVHDHLELEREDIVVSLNYARLLMSGISIEAEKLRTHRASEQVLSKDWLSENEKKAWQYL